MQQWADKEVFMRRKVPAFALTLVAVLIACADSSGPLRTSSPPHPNVANRDLVTAASYGTLVITHSTTLTEDHYGNIVIDAPDVTLDCAGHTVHGPGVGPSGGISVPGHDGVTVKRCEVTAFEVNGIFAGGSSNGRYEANIVHGNHNHGMHVDAGSGNVIVGNTSRSNGAIGIVLTKSTGSRIEGNTVQDHTIWAGIALFDGSQDNLVIRNTANRNALGFVLVDAVNNELRLNIANSNAGSGFEVNGETVHDNLLDSNTANANKAHGFVVTEGAYSNTLSGNLANANNSEGFLVYRARSNTFSGNRANANGQHGFLVWGGSTFNAFIGNSGRANRVKDATDADPGGGNVWTDNRFGTTEGF
jgi:parallel beta-helix repeat protein